MTLLSSCFHLSFEQFDFIVVSFLVTCRKTLIVLLAVGQPRPRGTPPPPLFQGSALGTRLAVGATPLHELKPVWKNFTKKKTSHKTDKLFSGQLSQLGAA